ncbi:sodium/proton-translocating pyrophosphatase [Thermoproteota archaeon]
MNFGIIFPLILSVTLLVFGIYLYLQIKKIPIQKGPVNELSVLIAEGLQPFSKRIFSSIIQILIYLTVVLFIFSRVYEKAFSWIQVLAFVFGGALMTISSYIALKIAPKMIPKIIQNSNEFLKDCLKILISSSSAIGFIIFGTMISGLILCYSLLGVDSVVGYGTGVMLVAFFLRIGGGLYKSGTDIGADILPKIEHGLPHFDKRNPATILDLSGDFVGDIIGFSSDILGSFIFSVIACILLPYALIQTGYIDPLTGEKLLNLPFYIIGIGLASALIIYCFYAFRSKTKMVDNLPMEGIYIGVIICGIGVFLITMLLNINIDIQNLWGSYKNFKPFLPYLIGLAGAVLIAFTSEYMTSKRFFPARKIAREAEYGPVIAIFNGLSVGLKSNVFFLIYLLLITLPSFYFAGFYGIAMASMGMLSMTSLILVTNILSPMAANTKKLAILTNQSENIMKNAVRMDHLGNSTVSLGNGFASGAAALSTFSLFFSLVLIANIDLQWLLLVDMKLLSGLIIGISIPFVFSGFLLSALIKIILKTVHEVSRQFKEIPFLIENKARPDIIKAADDNVIIAMNALVIPGIIMGFTPIAIGFIFGIKVLIGVVLGTFLSGVNQGFYWANFGDSLNNAKHYIQNGHYGGQKSPTFQNILIADNTGDAFKDLLSPSVNILIKSTTIIAILVIMLLTI